MFWEAYGFTDRHVLRVERDGRRPRPVPLDVERVPGDGLDRHACAAGRLYGERLGLRRARLIRFRRTRKRMGHAGILHTMGVQRPESELRPLPVARDGAAPHSARLGLEVPEKGEARRVEEGDLQVQAAGGRRDALRRVVE
jgi:hypothetical protein